MATITTPAAGVSPYQESAAAPTVLRASADGTTVLATAASAAATVSELAETAANTLVVVNGESALNSLIATSRSGVFDGANVTINLEEQNFNTTNQVTATTNYADGANGSIQYNNGANGFAGDAYFTYTNSNIITPGIRTDSYLLANGAPFLAGGNAAIGNFVFSGDTITISDVNQVMSINGNGTGNVQVTSNTNVWTFDNDGNLTLPSNTSSINYANGSPYGSGGNYSNSNVSSFLAVFGSNVVSTTGNITGGNLTTTGTANVASLAVTGSVTVSGSIGVSSSITVSSYLSANGNILTGNNVSAAGNITGNFFIGNGSQLTGIAVSYGNANVVANLAALGSNPVSTTGNVTGGNLLFGAGIVSGTGNITGGNLSGTSITGTLTTGTQSAITSVGTLTNMSTSGNANVTGNVNSARVSATGNITAGNILTGGLISVAGNITAGNLDAVNLVINSIRSDDSTFVTIEDGVDVNGEISATGNITGNYFIGNGSELTGIIADTGNVTFDDQVVVGTGDSIGGGGLYLAPGNASVGNLQYLRVRGGDVATHIHFDTGNNAYYDQYFGADNRFVKLEATGNVVINADDYASNGASWTFAADGNLTFPTGNLVITPDDPAGNIASIVSTDHPLAILSTGANGSTATFWVEDFANFGTSNIAAVYVNPVSQTGNVQIQTGNNSSITAWNFTPDGNLTLPNGAVINDTVGNAVAFGRDAAATGPQGNAAVAIGQQAGETSQGDYAVAVGYRAGETTQGESAVAIGEQAGMTTQGGQAVAVGLSAGFTGQGARAVAIGWEAGYTGQGIEAVAIGWLAGVTNQGNNSIILNATGAQLNQTTANTFTVAPVRNDVANIANIMFYNATSNEITYGNTVSVAGNITGGNVLTAGQVSATGNITGGNLSVTGNITGNTAGFALGYLNVPQVSFAGNATIAATDAGKHYYSVLNTANVLTIANNTSVSWAVGTAISLVNQGTGNITVAQGTGVSLYLAGNATAGNRTVATYGMATLLNVAANIWMINGTGVT